MNSPIAPQVPQIAWNADGLVPVVVQEEGSGSVLMMAWMNQQALLKTLETQQMHYWSRSRGCLWHKGATSGDFQYVRQLKIDCDNDTLLAVVAPVKAACHTGEHSCFFRPLDSQ